MKWDLSLKEQKYKVHLPDRLVDGEEFSLSVNNQAYLARWARSLGTLYLRADRPDSCEAAYRIRSANVQRFAGEHVAEVSLELAAAECFQPLCLNAQAELDVPAATQRAKAAQSGGQTLRAPMAGKVVAVLSANAQQVQKGDAVLIIEAMKMENRILAPKTGFVRDLRAEVGSVVGAGDVLFVIEATPA